jgi:hypothetical protein
MNEMVTGQDIVPMDLMQRAVTSGADVVVLEKLMGLQERYEANKARKAFDDAIAAFKAEVPQIGKDRLVDFTTNKGRTRYRYEDLSTIAEAVDKPLSKVGLSYRWRTVSTSPTSVTVTCIVSHRDGYSEENSLSAGPDPTGNKNSIQALGSAVTYLQRYTLKAALGLTASEDDDGQSTASGSNDPVPPFAQYVQRWEMLIENAMSADSLKSAWNAERGLRGAIVWPDDKDATRTLLQRSVMQRVKDFEQADKEPETTQPDLATQRLEAQDT